MSEYIGIRTHNLKEIDFSLKKGEITLLCGCSGSGKTSLAIDTIYAISSDEMSMMTGRRGECEQAYSLDSYAGILPAICLYQDNHNTNPRSTIASYFRLNQFLIGFLSLRFRVSSESINPGISTNWCRRCGGLGYISVPNKMAALDMTKALREGPLLPWRHGKKDLYGKLLEAYCKSQGIPLDVRLDKMDMNHLRKLLYGESEEKFRIEFNVSGRKCVRTVAYKGVIRFLEEVWEACGGHVSGTYGRYFKNERCEDCLGSRLDAKFSQYVVYGNSVTEIYTMSFVELHKFILRMLSDKLGLQEQTLLMRLDKFVACAIDMSLGHLSLSRSIPSLSGGELQRLGMVKVMLSQFDNFLYVLDEPISSLHPLEHGMVLRAIRRIKDRGNTVLILDHTQSCKRIADKVAYLGPSSGLGGGQLVEPYDLSYAGFYGKCNMRFIQSCDSVLLTNVNLGFFKIDKMELPLRSLVGLCGVSGAGKSTFARQILSFAIPGLIYVKQEPIHGNSYSTVATAIDVLKDIEVFWSRMTGTKVENFDFRHPGRGRCSLCKGTGQIIETGSFSTSRIGCPECNGARYSKNTLRIKYNGVSLHEFLDRPISDAAKHFPDNSSIRKTLNLACVAGLGYLHLSQDTSTLSGGEAQRIKMVSKISKCKDGMAFAFDEPFRGVDAANAIGIMKFFKMLVEEHKSTIYIIEHNMEILKCCSYLIELSSDRNGRWGKIVFNGKTSDIKKCKGSKTKDFLSI